MNEINIGDFIVFQDCTKETYPGRVIKIQNDGKVLIEICINKRKTDGNNTEIVECFASQLSVHK